MRRSWFEGKKCLDVGCNEGYLTLALVRSFRPRRIIGIDIDSYLVQRAGRVSKMGRGVLGCKRECVGEGTGTAGCSEWRNL